MLVSCPEADGCAEDPSQIRPGQSLATGKVSEETGGYLYFGGLKSWQAVLPTLKRANLRLEFVLNFFILEMESRRARKSKTV